MTVAAEPSRAKTNVSGSRPRPRGRLRARLTGVAAALGVMLGALAFPAAAQAADFSHRISGGNDPFLDVGGTAATVTVDVQATFSPGHGPKSITVDASLSGLDGYASVDVVDGGACARVGEGVAQCDNMTSGQSVQIQFNVAPAAEADLPEGETETGELTISGGGQSDGVQKTSVTVVGNAGPETVTEITGTITSNAEPVSGAKVVLTDGEGSTHETNTNDSGEFSFQGSGQEPIAPGEMTLKATKEGFEDLEESFQIEGSERFERNLTMSEVEAEPTETTEAPPTETATSAAPEAAAEEDEGGLSGTLITLIVIGGLLVIGGVVGIVFLLRGGKDKDEDDDDGESFAEAPPDHQPTAAQVGSPGVYQAGPAPGQDAPTMVHNGPLVQEQEAGSSAPTAFGPAYGGPGDDSTQVMPQAGAPGGPPPPMPPAPPAGGDDTQILSTVKGLDRPGSVPPPPMSDSTQVMPQANMSSRPPQDSFSDPGATQPYQSPTPPPSQPPTGRQQSAAMFEPHQQPAPGSQPPLSRDPYAPSPQPSQPPSPPSSDPYPSRGLGRDPYAPPPSPQPSQPSQPPSSDPYPSRGLGRDPYAPPPSGSPADPYSSAPTQAMPQGGPGEPSYGAHSPYAAERPGDEGSPNSRRREEEEHRGWGEWDDRPRSW